MARVTSFGAYLEDGSTGYWRVERIGLIIVKIAIDFDSTIHDPFNVKKGYKMGQPVPGAVEAVKYLKDQGHYIIIFPTWADNMQRRKALVDWLTYFKVPFDDVTSVKPDVDFYIDNNAVRFESWAQTLDFIKQKS